MFTTRTCPSFTSAGSFQNGARAMDSIDLALIGEALVVHLLEPLERAARIGGSGDRHRGCPGRYALVGALVGEGGRGGLDDHLVGEATDAREHPKAPALQA